MSLVRLADRKDTNLDPWPVFVCMFQTIYFLPLDVVLSGYMDEGIRGHVHAWEHFEMHHVFRRSGIDSQLCMSWPLSQKIVI